jgi:hypothetical protein
MPVRKALRLRIAEPPRSIFYNLRLLIILTKIKKRRTAPQNQARLNPLDFHELRRIIYALHKNKIPADFCSRDSFYT